MDKNTSRLIKNYILLLLFFPPKFLQTIWMKTQLPSTAVIKTVSQSVSPAGM